MADKALTKAENIRGLLEKSKAQIQLALPKHINADRMLRVVMTSIQKNPELLECTPKSLIGAVIQASQLGLEPDGVLGQAYLIPYKNGQVKEVQFQIGYKGLIALSRRGGDILSFSAHVVYEKDKFEYEFGLNEKLVHIPTKEQNRGELTFAYAIARFKDGGHAFEVMTKADIEKIKKSSQSHKSKYSPWQNWEPEMWRKTVAKKLCKYLPQSIELQRASESDDYIDLGFENLPSMTEIATDHNKEELKEKIRKKIEGQKKPETKKETTDDVEKPEKPEPPTINSLDLEFETEINQIASDAGLTEDAFKRELLDLGYQRLVDIKGEDQTIVLKYFKDNFPGKDR